MDFENIPFAKFFEEVIPWLCGIGAERIAVAAINADGDIGSVYFKCDYADKVAIADTIKTDALDERLTLNIRHFRKLMENDKKLEEEEQNADNE